jgi:hypothetical protein
VKKFIVKAGSSAITATSGRDGTVFPATRCGEHMRRAREHRPISFLYQLAKKATRSNCEGELGFGDEFKGHVSG